MRCTECGEVEGTHAASCSKREKGIRTHYDSDNGIKFDIEILNT